MQARTPRRGVAALLVIAWLFGFELAPAVHVGFHALWSNHQHHSGSARVTSGGERPRDRGHRRDHGHRADDHHDDRHEHDHDHGDRGRYRHSSNSRDTGDDNAKDRGEDPAHGSGSLAHRDLTSLPAPLPLLVPAVAPSGPADRLTAVGETTPRVAMPTARQRGPPSLLLAIHI